MLSPDDPLTRIAPIYKKKASDDTKVISFGHLTVLVIENSMQEAAKSQISNFPFCGY